MIKLEACKLSDGGIHLHLNGEINGRELRFILDTGASHTVLDLAWIQAHEDSFDIESLGDPAHGIGSPVDTFRCKVDRFELGDITLNDYSLPLIDFTAINQIYAKEELPAVHGILGGDILLKYAAMIDYDSMTLDFIHP